MNKALVWRVSLPVSLSESGEARHYAFVLGGSIQSPESLKELWQEAQVPVGGRKHARSRSVLSEESLSNSSRVRSPIGENDAALARSGSGTLPPFKLVGLGFAEPQTLRQQLSVH